MATTDIHIISQDDAQHKQFIQELQKKYADKNFQIEFIAKENPGNKLSNTHAALDAKNSDLVILAMEELPFPLKSDKQVIAILESEEQANKLYALIANSEHTDNFIELTEKSLLSELGQVYLVGAGQSTKDQLTLRAFALIEQADIIFYDSLIDTSILDFSNAEKVFVGKRANKHHKQQADINTLLFEAALKHKTVVRIKGGDPMIFGHAGEEIAFLEARCIKVETVPGITSPIGAAVTANMPLTLRNISNSVSFCSAHEKSKILVPDTDTIVYFMGASNLKNIAKALIKHEKPASTPVTLFHDIGSKNQEIYYETIQSILTNNIKYKSPLLAIVGEVGNRENWHKAFNYKPRILFTGSHVAKYSHLGYVFHQPMIEIAALDEFKKVDIEIESINSNEWICFTSMYAVGHFFNRLYDLGYDARYLTNLKIASIGRFTSKQLKKYGIQPDLQATEESSDGLLKLFKEKGISRSSILIPRSNLAMDYLPDGLATMGNKVKKLVVYTNRMPVIDKKVEVENFDQVIFTSPSCVDNFMKVYKKLPQVPEIITRGKETKKRIAFYKQSKE